MKYYLTRSSAAGYHREFNKRNLTGHILRKQYICHTQSVKCVDLNDGGFCPCSAGENLSLLDGLGYKVKDCRDKIEKFF